MKIAAMLFRRTGNGLALLVAVLVLNFTLIHIAPGDVADTIAGDMGGADAEVMAQIRRDYGLDLPFHEQLLAYVAKLARLDLGYSFFFNRPVTELLLERLPATLLLVISAQVLAIMLGTVLGVFAARRPNGLLSHGVTIFALLGFSAPVFWTGIMLIILLCSIFPLFPVAGMGGRDGGGRVVREDARRAAPPVPAHAHAGLDLPRALQPARPGEHAGRARHRLRAHRPGEGALPSSRSSTSTRCATRWGRW